MIKLIIFDLDGTLLNTIDDLAVSCNYALSRCGCPERDRNEYFMLVGRGIDNLFRGALPEDRRSDDMVAQMRSFFIPHYNEHGCDLTKPYDGITDMLEELEASGMKMVIASNKYQEGTEALVRRYFGKFDFAGILGQRPNKPIKPDPLIVQEAMSMVPGIKKEEVIYCGDSDVDMLTGNNAGVRTIGVTWGFRSREELSRHNPWLMVEKPSEISHIVL